jgi:hypothetical protein
MKPILIMIPIFMASIFQTGCVNYRVGNDVENQTVMAAKTGKDCTSTLFGLGRQPTVNRALKNGGITTVRVRYDTNTSFLGIGRYCHVVVGE